MPAKPNAAKPKTHRPPPANLHNNDQIARGLPTTLQAAHDIVTAIAAHKAGDPTPLHWPHAHIVALAQVSEYFGEQVAGLLQVVEMQQEDLRRIMEREDKLKEEIIELKQNAISKTQVVKKAETPAKRGPGRPPKTDAS